MNHGRRHDSESGNIFFTLFGAVALVGIVGAATSTLMRGPVGTVVTLNQHAKADSQMAIAAKLAMLEAQQSTSDCDSDTLIEPLGPAATGGNPAPVGGGLLPSVGASQRDPWGSMYAYCGWDHGTAFATNCSGNGLLRGNNAANGTVIAILSAGPNRTFETSCVNDPTYVSKPGGSDDLVVDYTYAEANEASGGLWFLKSGDPNTITTDRTLDVQEGASFSSGQVDFTGSTIDGQTNFAAGAQLDLGAGGMFMLPDEVALPTCNPTNTGLLRRNTSGGTAESLQICNGATSTWANVGGAGGTTAAGAGGQIQFNSGNLLAASGDLTWNGTELYADADGEFTGDLVVGATADITGTLAVDGATTIDDTMGVTGAVDLDSTLNVDGDADFNQDLTVDAATELNGTLNVDGAATLTSTLAVTGAATFSEDIRAKAGTAGDPAITFNTDQTTGIYYSSSGMGFSATGTTRLRVDSSGIDVTGAVEATGTLTGTRFIASIASSAASPAFEAAAGAGMYSAAANTLSFSTGSTSRVTIDAMGDVGIGVANPAANLDVGGEIKVGMSAATCAAGLRGAIRYDSAGDELMICSATGNWETVGTSGGGGSGAGSYWTKLVDDRIYYLDDFVGMGTNDPLAASHTLGNFLVTGTFGAGADTPVSGAGTRAMFIPKKSAFRAGTVSAAGEWDDASVGIYSAALGKDTIAAGSYSFATGDTAQVNLGADRSFAIGTTSYIDGDYSMGLLTDVYVTGNYSMGIGLRNLLGGNYSTVSGDSSLGLFMGMNNGIDLAAANTFGVLGGKMIIDQTPAANPAVSGTLSLDVEGGVGATQYCDENGLNCFTALSVLGAVPGTPVRSVQFNSGGSFWGDPNFVFSSTGQLGIGTSAPEATFDVGGTDALIVARGSTAQRPVGAVNGMIRYNSTTSKFEVRENNAWVNLVTGTVGAAAPDRGIQFNSGGSFAASSNLVYTADGDVLLSGTYTGTASVPVTGAGTRLFFDTQKAALRSGRAAGTEWDNAGIGSYSTAMGYNVSAAGESALALGQMINASGNYAVALGYNLNATAESAVAIGKNSTASANGAVALGWSAEALGAASYSLGTSTYASGISAYAFGQEALAGNGTAGNGQGDYSVAFGLGDSGGTIATWPRVTGTNSYGVFMGDRNGESLTGNNTFAILGGRMLIVPSPTGAYAAPTVAMDINANDAIILPRGATGARPGGVNGMIRYNDTSNKFEVFENSSWRDLVTAGGSGGAASPDRGVQFNSGGSFAASSNLTYSSTGQFIISGGTATAPSYTILGDLNTGMFSDTADRLEFAAGGTQALALGTTASGVNYFLMTPGASGAGPTLSSVSTNTNGAGLNMNITALDASAAGVGGAINLTAGASSGANLAGGINLTGGSSATFIGGTVNLTGGTGAFNGGAVVLAGGAAGNGGPISIAGGASSGGSGSTVAITGGATSNAGSAGGQVNIMGGPSSTSGAGGAINITGGLPTEGNGGAINITGRNGAGTNRNGGNVTVIAGNATGAGTDGSIILQTDGSATTNLTLQAPGATELATAVFGGTSAVTLPGGSTAQRPDVGVNGMIRYNTANGRFEAFQAGAWQDILTNASLAAAPDRGIQFNSGGAMAASSNLTYSSTGQFIISGGTATAPSYTILGDLNTGMFSDTADALEFTAGGTQVLQLGTTASGVNYFRMVPGVSGAGPTMTTVSTNTNGAGLNMNIVAPNASAAGNGGAIVLTGGDGNGGASTGGGINLTGGTGGLIGGTISLTAGSSTAGLGGAATLKGGNSASGIASGAANVTGGDGSGGNTPGGVASVSGGNATGSATGGTGQLLGGTGGPTGAGGAVIIGGGPGGSTSGAGGTVWVQGGLPTDGNGGNVNLTARNGVGTNRNGGSLTLQAGNATGAGTDGNIIFFTDGGATGNLTLQAPGATELATAVFGGTSALITPNGTTAQRPDSGLRGMVRYNTQTEKFEGFVNNAWVDFTTGATVTPGAPDRGVQFNSGGSFSASSDFVYGTDGDLLLTGSYTGTASAAVSGAGTRMFFDVQMGAFRAGYVSAAQWNSANIGSVSFAANSGTTASGAGSAAFNNGTTASGVNTFASGFGSVASGSNSFASGYQTTAAGDNSFTLGREVDISGAGDGSMAIGLTTAAQATNPVVSGAESLGIFLGDHSGINFSQARTMGVFGGNLVIDPNEPATQLSARGVIDVGAATDAIVIPRGNTAQRPGSAYDGMVRYNSQTNKFEGRIAGAWADFVTGATVSPGAPDRGIQFNSGGGFAASSNFVYGTDGDLLLSGTYTGIASPPATGAGTRLFFDVQRAAFRAGDVTGTQWNSGSLGDYSIAVGQDPIASGAASAAFGRETTASGNRSLAIGWLNTASGAQSFAGGLNSSATTNQAFAFGNAVQATGLSAAAFGSATIASGATSFSAGTQTAASGFTSIALGRKVTTGSGTAGDGAGDGSMAIGLFDDATTITTSSRVTGVESLGIFMGDQDGLTMSANRTMGLFGGLMVIDPAVPATQLSARATLDMGAATDAVIVPRGNTAQRPGSAYDGMIRYNSQTGKFEGRVAGAWADFSTGTVSAAAPDRGVQFNSGGSFAASANFTYTALGQLALAGGTAAAPGYSLLGDLNTGMFSDTADTLEFTAGGTQALALGTTASGVNYFRMVPGASGAGPTLTSVSANTNGTGLDMNIAALNASAAGNGGTVVLTGGNGNGGASLGGGISATGGTGSLLGGAVTITAGSSTNWGGPLTLSAGASSGYFGGGDALVAAGNGTSGNAAGGSATLRAGSASGGTDGGTAFVTGGAGGATAAGGPVNITGGAGGATSGTGGSVTISGGVPNAGNGGDITISGSNGVGTNRSGGAVTINAGNATGSGVDGTIVLKTDGGSTTNLTLQAPGATELATAVFGGTSAVTLPGGSTAQRPDVGVNGMIRYNTANGRFEAFQAGAWQDILTNASLAASPDRGIQFNSGGAMAAASTFIYTASGDVGIGTTTPLAQLDIGGTGAILIPRGTTAQRPASPYNGMIRYNSQTGKFEGRVAGSWTDFVNGTGGATAINDLTDALKNTTDNNLFMAHEGGGGLGSNNINNTGIGIAALDSLNNGSEGDNNTALGYVALTANTNGYRNVALGSWSLDANTTGFSNTAVGYNTLGTDTDGEYNTAVGDSALASNNANYNVAVGGASMTSNTTGSFNTAIGTSSMQLNQTGEKNTGLGNRALYANISSSENTAVGYYALEQSTAGLNTAVGSLSLRSNVGGQWNTALGENTLQANVGGNTNTAVGSKVLFDNNSGSWNVGIGGNALENNTTADGNVAVGFESGYNNATGAGNVAMGYRAMKGVAANNHNNNTAIGYEALTAVTTGGNNTVLGYKAGDNITTGASNIVIGYDLDAASATGNSQINIGGLITGDMATANIAINGVGALRIPHGATADRPGTAYNGMIRYNSQTNKFEGRVAGAWADFTTGTVGAANPSRGIQFNSGGSFAATSDFIYAADGDLLLSGSYTNVASPPTQTAWTSRIFYDVQKAAFRGGQVGTGGQWDAGNLGSRSFAFGANPQASGNVSVAIGEDVTAGGANSVALGVNASASGTGAVALGSDMAAALNSVTMGRSVNATGDNTMAFGAGYNTPSRAVVSGNYSVGFFLGNNSAVNVTGTNVFAINGGRLVVSGTAANAGSVAEFAAFGAGVNRASSIILPRDNTANRPGEAGMPAALNGMIRYNSQTNKFEGYVAGAWADFITGSAAAAIDDLTDAKKDTTNNNLFMAHEGGAAAANNDYNTGIGINALDSLNNSAGGGEGDLNTAVGYNALTANTSGHSNTALGYAALASNTNTNANTAVGRSALTTNSSGGYNTAIGHQAAAVNASGDGNTAIGADALYSNSTSGANVAVGVNALYYNVGSGAAGSNTAIGHSALSANTTGLSNVGLGAGAGNNITTGSSNIIIGAGNTAASATASNQLDIGNTITGDMATGNIAINGVAALRIPHGATADRPGTAYNGMIRYNSQTDKFEGRIAGAWADFNTGSGGSVSIDSLSDGISNTTSTVFLGTGSGAANTGADNTAVGISVLATNVAKTGSTAMGFEAMRYADSTGTTGISYNTAIGYRALRGSTTAASNTGTHNTALGHSAMVSNTSGAYNVAIGSGSMPQNTIGNNNISIGYNSMLGNKSGQDNVAIGSNALYFNDGASGSTAVGSGAMNYANTTTGAITTYNTAVGALALLGQWPPAGNTGTSNTALGHSALLNVTTGSNNVGLGAGAADNLSTGSRNITIGSGVDAVSATGSDQLNIGNTIYGNLASDYVGIGNSAPSVALDVTGDIEYTGTITDVSDMRLKRDIRPLLDRGSMLAKISGVNTYSFRMKNDTKGQVEFGVMAQEIEGVFPELVRTAEDEMKTKSVNYVGMIAPMIEATKELKAENDALKAELASMKAERDDMQVALSELAKDVKGLKAHTGYGISKASAGVLILSLLTMLAGMGAFALALRARRRAPE